MVILVTENKNIRKTKPQKIISCMPGQSPVLWKLKGSPERALADYEGKDLWNKRDPRVMDRDSENRDRIKTVRHGEVTYGW